VPSYQLSLKPLARQLRSQLTDAEQWLWHKVRRKQFQGVQFYRQRPVGPYIVDFYAPSVRLVVEVDGGQHFEAEYADRDQRRDHYLRGRGLQVLRFDNLQVLREGQAVLDCIWAHIETVRRSEAAKSPLPPFGKGG